jgi:hypothetical protein
MSLVIDTNGVNPQSCESENEPTIVEELPAILAQCPGGASNSLKQGDHLRRTARSVQGCQGVIDYARTQKRSVHGA